MINNRPVITIVKLLINLTFLLFCSMKCFGQTPNDSLLGEIIGQKLTVNHFPGEQLELPNLKLNYNFEHVRIPGPSKMDLVVGRTYYQQGVGTVSAGLNTSRDLAGFGFSFDFHVPLIQTIGYENSSIYQSRQGYDCVTSKDYFSINFYVPNSRMITVGYSSSGDLPSDTLLSFSNNSIFACEGGPNGEPIIRLPDGRKITFGKSIDSSTGSFERLTHFPTMVEDRFGNEINYNYDSDVAGPQSGRNIARISSITRNDGARVDFDYISRPAYVAGTFNWMVSKIRYHGREINFGYPTDNPTHWFDDEENRRTTMIFDVPFGRLSSIEIPTGARAEYVYWGYQPDLGLSGQVQSKTISGPDIASRSFTYLFNIEGAGQYPFVTERENNAIGTDDLHRRFRFSSSPQGFFDENEQSSDLVTNGRVTEYTVFQGGVGHPVWNGKKLLQIRNNWEHQRLGIVGCNKQTSANGRYRICARPLLASRTTTMFDSSGTAYDEFTIEMSSFDKFGQSGKQVASGINPAGYRYELQEYLNSKDLWLIGLPTVTKRSSSDSNYTEVFEQNYYSPAGPKKALPNETFRFGRLVERATAYHLNGELKQRQFNGLNKIENYLNYQRGTPQLIEIRNGISGPSVSRSQLVDVFGNMVRSTDFRGNAIDYVYDGLNRLTRTDFENAKWHDEVSTYDDSTRSLETKTGNRWVTEYFDGLGRSRLLYERDSQNVAETSRYYSTAYTKQGLVRFTSFPSANLPAIVGVANLYDGIGRIIQQVNIETGATRSLNYLVGHKIEQKDGRGFVTRTSFRSFGSPDFSLPTRVERQITLELGGDDGGPPDDPVCPVHDPKCAYEDITPARFVLTEIDYNLFDQVIAVDQNAKRTTYVYDEFSSLCKVSRSDVGDTALKFSPVGLRLWSTKGATGSSDTCESLDDNNKVTDLYDYRGLYTGKLGANSEFRVFSLDPDGFPMGGGSNNGDLMTYSYDDRGNRTQKYNYNPEYNDFSQIDNEYDSHGSLSAISYPDKTRIELAPNALGQPTQIGSLITNIKYHPTGAVESYTFGNGLTRTVTHNSGGIIQDIQDSSGSAAVFSQYYNYDEELNLTNAFDAFQSDYDITNAHYDGVGRLIGVDGYWGHGSYEYDDSGNILSSNLGQRTSDYSYLPNGLLDEVVGDVNRDFSYDNRGSVVNNGMRSFGYNALGDLVTSEDWVFEYNVEGLRAGKTQIDGNGNSTSTYFIYDENDRLFVKKKESGEYTKYYYLRGSLVAAQTTNGGVTTTEYMHTGALSSIAAISDQAGTITQRFHYEPFGRAIESGQEDDPGYTGHLYDGNLQLNYMKARYYDPEIGRFYSNDPLGFDAYNPISFNRYAYANNSPLKFVDETGEAGKVGWLVRFVEDGFERVRPVTKREAVEIRKSGRNFEGKTKPISKQVEVAAHGRENLLRHSGQPRPGNVGRHQLPDGSGLGRPHYQTAGKRGHSYWSSAAAALSVVGAKLTEVAADAVELTDPLGIQSIAEDPYFSPDIPTYEVTVEELLNRFYRLNNLEPVFKIGTGDVNDLSLRDRFGDY